ncbi:MAG: MFS transporter [Trueperaceae bacterium]|nr:MFS transporter [Trueperaceae bacterium]
MPLWKKNLYIMFAAQILSTMGFSMIFPFLPNYVAHLGSSFGFDIVFLAGAVYSGQAITMALTSPIWGTLADRFGKKLMVERAMFGGSILLLMMAFVPNAEMLVLVRTIQGAVTGTVGAANALVAATAPRERMGYAMGMLQVGVWAGVALGPLIGGVLADAFGYNMAFYFTAALLFIGGIIVFIAIEEPNDQREKKQGTAGMVAEWRTVLGAPGVSLVFFFRFISWLGRNILVPYLPLFMATLILSQDRLNTLTGLTIALASAAGTVTAVVLGRLGDQIGHKKILIGCAFAAALFYIPQFFVTHVWQLLVLQALTGGAAGGIMPVLSALLNHYTKPGHEGAAFGFDNSVTSLSRAVAPMIGATIVLFGGYRLIFLCTALLFAATGILAIFKLPDLNPRRLSSSSD